MRYTLKDIKVLRKEQRWPDGYHYVCETIDPKIGKYEFFLDEEEYNAIKSIEDLNLPEKTNIEIMKVIEEYGYFKYSEGRFDENQDESL